VSHAATTASSDSSYESPGLATATSRPWNPPSPVAEARPWETAVRLPGRILSLPFVGLGMAAEDGLIWADETDAFPRVAAILVHKGRLGIDLSPATLGDATGLGAEFRWTPPQLRRHLTLAASGSLHQYNRERIVADLGPVRASFVSEWRPSEPWFGRGLSSPHSEESSYAVRSEDARVGVLWNWPHVVPVSPEELAATRRPELLRRMAPLHRTQFGAWVGPSEERLSHGRHPDDPSIELLHPDDAAGVLDRRIEHLVYGVRLAHDARTGLPHWASGWLGAIEAERYDKPIESLALSSAQPIGRSFTRVTYDAEAGASFGRDPRTLRLAVRVVDQYLDHSDGAFPLTELSTLGGSALSGFEPGRFRDLDLLLVKLTYLYPLGKNLEADLHTEAGGVTPNLGDLRGDRLKPSYGAALRLRTEQAMLGRVGIDWSSEAVRLRFSLGGVE